MKNRIFTVTIAQLNSLSITIIDTPMEIIKRNVAIGVDFTEEILYPGQIIIKNSTGVNLEYNTFNSLNEYNDSLINSQYYDMIPISEVEVIQNPNALRIAKIVIRKSPTDIRSAASNLYIQCINYRLPN